MKVATWEACVARLKPAFQRAAITRCELHGRRCAWDNFLGFAHAKKRRNLPADGSEDATVILACNICHDTIERLPEDEMGRIVMRTIAARRNQPDASLSDEAQGFEHRLDLDGLTAFVSQVTHNGRQITVCGFLPCRRKFREADRLLLVSKDGSEARYVVRSTEFPFAPRDQYFLACEFLPRPALYAESAAA